MASDLSSIIIVNVAVLLLLQACQYCRQGHGSPPITSPPIRYKLELDNKTKDSPSRKPLLESHTSALNNLSDNNNTSVTDSCSISCEKLMNSCLKYIDRNAKNVLAHEQFLKLDIDLVSMILSRDSLQVSSELTVVTALAGWIKTRDRRALCGAQYLVRYFTLTEEELRGGVEGRGLLEAPEEESILAFMRGEGDLPEHLIQLRYLWEKAKIFKVF